MKTLIRQLSRSDEAGLLFESLAGTREPFAQLDETLEALLAEHGQFTLPQLAEVLSKLREQTGLLTELLPVLGELADLPEPFSHALAPCSGAAQSIRVRYRAEEL